MIICGILTGLAGTYLSVAQAAGFTRDMPVEELGSRVILPPWLEAEREAVEARLTPLPDPRANWPVRS